MFFIFVRNAKAGEFIDSLRKPQRFRAQQFCGRKLESLKIEIRFSKLIW